MASPAKPAPPASQPAPLAACMDRALQRLAELSGSAEVQALDGNELLMERAWLGGARFSSGRSCNGATRGLNTTDGVIAVTLARDDDWALVPAWLESSDPELAAAIDRHCTPIDAHALPDADAIWQRLAEHVRRKSAVHLIAQGRVLGLPVAATGAHRELLSADFSRLFTRSRPAAPVCSNRPPRVIDLSALWAGPLCSHLLQLCGAEVIKVESISRPDGARAGQQKFFDLLNQGKRSVALDLTAPQGLRALRGLIESADMVIESSRPRALRQLGIRAEEIVRKRPTLIWISLTGHGRAEPRANWTAFGDDAGVAAGLSDVMMEAVGTFQFAGDAIADPLTGAHAALAAWQAYASGRGGIIELALTDIAAFCLREARAASTRGSTRAPDQSTLHDEFRRWWETVRVSASAPPDYHSREIHGPAAALGVDTEAVLQSMQRPC